MTAEEWKAQLAKEGYGELWEKTDPPGLVFKEHTHPVDTTHVFLQGSATAWTPGSQGLVLKAGDRWDVPKHTPHWSTTGPAGCTYIIGVRI